MDPETDHIEPAAEMLTPADPDILAAVDATLANEPVEAPAASEEPAAPVDPVEPASDAPATETPAQVPETPAEPVAETPAAEPPAAARPSDEFGELPKDAPERTRERFEAMRTRYDELHQREQAASERANQWVSAIESTGATPEEFGQAMQALAAMKSGTPEGLQVAFDILQSNLAAIAEQLGREAPGVDPLARHPDLQQRVENNLIEREDAIEIAQARAQRDLGTRSRETQQAASVEDRAYADVRAFGAEMRKADPNFQRKMDSIKPIVERVVSKLPPAEWRAAVEDAYRAIPDPAPAPVAPPVSVPTPLRPTSAPGAGSQLSKTPGSPLEAMELALSNL